MRIARRDSCPVLLTKWGGEVCAGHETRDMKHESRPFPNHGRYGSSAVRQFFLERTGPPPKVFTNHESRVTAFTHRCPQLPVIARLFSSKSRLPTVARYCPEFPGILAAPSRHHCPRWPSMARRLPAMAHDCSLLPGFLIAPEQGSAHRLSLSVGLTTRVVRSSSCRSRAASAAANAK